MTSNIFLANALGLSRANVTATKKRDQLGNVVPVAPVNCVPLSAGANAFDFRNRGIAELFQGKQVNR